MPERGAGRHALVAEDLHPAHTLPALEGGYPLFVDPEQHLGVRPGVAREVGAVLRGLHHDLVRTEDGVSVGDHPDRPGLRGSHAHDLRRSVALAPGAEIALVAVLPRSVWRLPCLEWTGRPTGSDDGPQIPEVVAPHAVQSLDRLLGTFLPTAAAVVGYSAGASVAEASGVASGSCITRG
jgi:hypothetical protein